jgi:hypothetical protein
LPFAPRIFITMYSVPSGATRPPATRADVERAISG